MRKRAHTSPQFVDAARKHGISLLGLLIAVPALLYSISVGTPHAYVKSARTMLAAAAMMGASVAENPYNTLAAQLAEKEARLNQEEAALTTKSARAENSLSISEILGASSFFISIILLALVALNFYYDSRRQRTPALPRKYFVDLR